MSVMYGAAFRSSGSADAAPFEGLLLRYRGRCGLTQRQLAERVGVNRRSVQEWENGTTYPTPERLEAVIPVLLDAEGLTAGREADEAYALWSAARSASPRTYTPFDDVWFARLLDERSASQTRGVLPVSRAATGQTGSPATRLERCGREAAEDRASSGNTGRTLEIGAESDRREDWADAPDVVGFINRTDELALLRGWALQERCRLIAVLGMGGIGKTMLIARLAQQIASNFDCVYWRSVRDALPASEWLAGAIGFLSDHQVVLPSGATARLTILLQLLRERRCLLILDNLESLLEPGECDGSYREELADYRYVLEALGGAAHQSCVLLTSREAPAELGVLADGSVRTLKLGGLSPEFVQQILAPKQLVGTSDQWSELTARMGGNPRALGMIADTIGELFCADIGAFLEEARLGAVFGGIRRLLAEHVERGSALEQQLMWLLAVSPAPMSLRDLLVAVEEPIGCGTLLEAMASLRRRSLIECSRTNGTPVFTLQAALVEYVTQRHVGNSSVHQSGGGRPEGQHAQWPVLGLSAA